MRADGAANRKFGGGGTERFERQSCRMVRGVARARRGPGKRVAGRVSTALIPIRPLSTIRPANQRARPRKSHKCKPSTVCSNAPHEPPQHLDTYWRLSRTVLDASLSHVSARVTPARLGNAFAKKSPLPTCLQRCARMLLMTIRKT